MAQVRKRNPQRRILRLARLLERSAYTSAELAALLDCTQQEVQRDLRVLRAEGFHVQQSGRAGRGPHYSLAGGFAVLGVVTMTELRQSVGLSQTDVSRNLGTDQAHISHLERNSNMHLSTLRDFVGGLGGRLRLVVELASQTVELNIPRSHMLHAAARQDVSLRETVAAEYLNGAATTELARRHGLSLGTVMAWCAGLKHSKKGEE